MKQQTFMMLKPDATSAHLEKVILNELEKLGCQIEIQKNIQVDMKVMQTLLMHYQEVIDKMGPDFNFAGKLFNTFYYGKPMITVLLIAYEGEEDIIDLTRSAIGATNPAKADPSSIRGKYSKDCFECANQQNRLVHNLIHASDSLEAAQKEIALWLPYLAADKEDL